MSDSFKYVQAQNFSLSGAGAVSGATSITLKSFVGIDGALLTMTDFGTIGFGTLEPGTGTLEEQISFTGVTQNANGTATLTGVKSVTFISPYTQTSGLAKTHAGSTTFVISNTSGFYDQLSGKNDDETITGLWDFPSGANNPTIGVTGAYVAPTTDAQIPTKKYVDTVAIAGAPDAGTTTKGILKLSVAAVSATGPIGVGDNDTRVPPVSTSTLTTGQVAALIGSSGTASSGNKYVTQADTTGSLMPSGSITMYGGASAPTGWLLCDGTSYLQATYPALFAVLSTTYGSADGTHFNVPDLRGRVPVGVGTGTGGGTAGTGLPTGGSALTAVARATWKGEETHTLTTAEMPSHAHTFTIGSGGGNDSTYPSYVSNQSSTTTASTTATGGSGAHNTIQPVMGLQFIIKT